MTQVTTSVFWDRAAPKYAKSKISNVEAYEASLARTMSYLGHEDTVLEIGCGTGSTALRLAPQVRAYLGTDISSGMIGIAKEKSWEASLPQLSFRTTAENSDEAATYSRILAFNILHLLPNLDEVIAKTHRDLEPGGLFISKTPCLASKHYFRPLVWLLQKIGKAPWVGFLSPQGLQDQIASHGFEIVEDGLYPPSTPSAYFVARKI